MGPVADSGKVEIATTGMSSPCINAMIALLSCLTYIALDLFGAERPAILGRFKVPLTQVAGLIAFWARDETWARDFGWPSYRPSARPGFVRRDDADAMTQCTSDGYVSRHAF